MSLNAVIDGLIGYLCLLVLLTFHEAAHAWVAWKCGDDTAYVRGRVSLNPIVHMDLLGTVILPLVVVMLSAADSNLARFIIGWGKPVPVDPSNLSNRRVQDTLIAMAGPAINFALAVALVALTKVFLGLGLGSLAGVLHYAALISLLLCFFNLLPIPPLDGSHLVKNVFNISDERYLQFSRFGLILVIVALQLPFVRWVLYGSVTGTLTLLQVVFQVP